MDYSDISKLKEVDTGKDLKAISNQIQRVSIVGEGKYLPYYLAAEESLYNKILDYFSGELGSAPIFELGDAERITRPKSGEKGRRELIEGLKKKIESAKTSSVILKVSNFEQYLKDVPDDSLCYEAHVYDQNARPSVDGLNISKSLLVFTHIGPSQGKEFYRKAISGAAGSQHKERLFVFS